MNNVSSTVSPAEQSNSAQSAGADDSLIGQTLADKFLIESELGSGGMCLVYRAQHVMMGKRVAVKVLRPFLAADKNIVQRFEQEARAASRVHHPHAINVTDFGSTPAGRPYLVMDYIQGESLGDVLRQVGPLTVKRAALILRQVSGALEAAHAQGVIHRDIKPENIVLSEYEGRDWVTVLDFGVAKIQEDLNKKGDLTAANHIVGTPRYMSPEQAEDRAVDARSDIYSLGVVLYEMLTGEAPFNDDSATRLLVKQAFEPPPPLREKRPDISPELEAVIMSALAKDPEERPQTVSELTQSFEQAAGLTLAEEAVDRGGAFSRITVPIGAETEAAEVTAAPEPNEAATLVRPRAKTNTPAALPLPGRPGRTTTVTTNSGASWLVAALVILLGVLLAGAGFLYFQNQNPNVQAAESIDSARQAVVDARARVESLPRTHSLTTALPQLIRWEGELNGFAAAPEKTPAMGTRAEEIEGQATQLSQQARDALASLSIPQPVVGTPPPVAVEQSTPPPASGGEEPSEADAPKPAPETGESESKPGEAEKKEPDPKKQEPIEDKVRDIIEEVKKKAKEAKKPPVIPDPSAPEKPLRKPQSEIKEELKTPDSKKKEPKPATPPKIDPSNSIGANS